MMTSSNEKIFRVTGLCAGNSPVTGEFLAQRPVTRSFDVLFDMRQNKVLSKPSERRWFEMPSCSSWCHCNDLRIRVFLKLVYNDMLLWNLVLTLPLIIQCIIRCMARALQWRHNEHGGVSNHGHLDCLLNRLFGRKSKKKWKLRVT